MSYRFALCRYGNPRQWSEWDIAGGLHLSVRSVQRALREAEGAGLLIVERRPGCKLAIRLGKPIWLGQAQPPLYGPIPWRWWLPASRLPGSALPAAAACWLVAGWERSAEFNLEAGGWDELGLGPRTLSRGLGLLEAAGLVHLERCRGRGPWLRLEGGGAGERETVDAERILP